MKTFSKRLAHGYMDGIYIYISHTLACPMLSMVRLGIQGQWREENMIFSNLTEILLRIQTKLMGPCSSKWSLQ